MSKPIEEHIIGPCKSTDAYLHLRPYGDRIEAKIWGEHHKLTMYVPVEKLPALRDWLDTVINHKETQP